MLTKRVCENPCIRSFRNMSLEKEGELLYMYKIKILVVDSSMPVDSVLAETPPKGNRSEVEIVRCKTESALRSAVAQCWADDKGEELRLPLKTRAGILLLPSADILYCRAQGHRVLVYMANGSCISSATMRDPFSKAVAPLFEKDFLQPQRGSVVNIKHITRFTRTELTLSNGDTLAISRSMRTAFLKKLTEGVVSGSAHMAEKDEAAQTQSDLGLCETAHC